MNRRVLLIDDEPDLRSLARELLEERDYAVSEARDGAEGLRVLYDERPDVVVRSAAVLERNARRLLRLVNDLLLAQAQAGRLELDRELIDLRELVADASELGRPLAEQGRLTLSLDLPAPGTAMVNGDRLRLGQLLDNLVANALKFTPGGGEVIVGARAGAHGAELQVQDDGPGIAPEDQSQLYEAFVRGRHVSGPGTGLGLTIVRTVTDAHEAQIALHSSETGTRFTVTFPAVS